MPAVQDDGQLPSFFMRDDWDLGCSPSIDCSGLDPPQSLIDSKDIFSCRRRCRFRIQQSDRFGMVLEDAAEPLPGGLLVVGSIEASSVFARTVTGGCGLIAGDTIEAVNGLCGSAVALREALRLAFSARGQKTVELALRSRPPAFNIELFSDGRQKLGITASTDKANEWCLVVDRLHSEGLVPSWNEANGSLRICKDDLITHVNGIKGISHGVSSMKKEIQRSFAQGCKLRFRVVTPHGQLVGCHRDTEDSPWVQTTVRCDMQAGWLDDTASEISTRCGSSNPSGVRTPEEHCLLGERTLVEREGTEYSL